MTKWKALPVVVGIATVVFCSSIFAQTQPPPPRSGGAGGQDPRMEQGIDRMFQDMDTNRDGKISKKEWLAFYERIFEGIDKNRDGFLTRDEVRSDMAEHMKAMQQQQPPQQGGRAPQGQYPQ